MILSFGSRIRADGQEIESFAAAPHTRAAVIESVGEQHCVEIRLTPLGAHLVLDVPMDELAGRTLAFEDVWGDATLIERLHGARSWDARFALLDDVLAERLTAARPLAPEVSGAWHRLVATHGATSIAELVRESGWSRRHFTARFARAVGLPPKTFSRVLRFDRAKERLTESGVSLAEIARARRGLACAA